MLSISMKEEIAAEEKTKEIKIPKIRPYWYVDAKWICGLLLTGVLAVWLLVMAAYRITAPNTGVALTTNILAYAFSRNDLNETASVDALRAKIVASPTQSVQPIPGFPITVTSQDVNTLSPRDLRLKIFGQIAQPLYQKGPANYAKELTSDPTQQKKFENDAALFGLVTQQRHENLGSLAVKIGLLAVVLMAGTVFFSAGFGRLVTSAIVLVLASLPGLALFVSLHAWSAAPATATAQSEDIGAVIDATKGALTPAFASAQKIYLYTALAGAAVLAVAMLGKTIAHFLPKRPR